MKTIIVPTDFSKNAKHAAEYAVQMAQRQGNRVLLMHAYEEPTPVSDYEFNRIHFHSVKNQILNSLHQLKTALRNKFGTETPIDIALFNNDLIKHLSSLYAESEAFLVVIGLTGAGMFHFFMGSNTLKIVNNLGKAVLTIPPFTPFKPIRKIVFAFDLWHVEATLPIKRISRIRARINAELLILNVTDKGRETDEDWLREKNKLKDLMADTPYTFHTIAQNNVVDGIKKFATEQQADLLAIVPREGGFLENLLGENHTKTLLFRSGIPILSLPPDDNAP